MGSTGASRATASKINTPPISLKGSSVIVSDELKAKIFDITGTDRADVMSKLSNMLGGAIGIHGVWTGTSKHVVVGDYSIDITTQKKGGVQIIKRFMIYRSGDRSTISFYTR